MHKTIALLLLGLAVLAVPVSAEASSCQAAGWGASKNAAKIDALTRFQQVCPGASVARVYFFEYSGPIRWRALLKS